MYFNYDIVSLNNNMTNIYLNMHENFFIKQMSDAYMYVHIIVYPSCQ